MREFVSSCAFACADISTRVGQQDFQVRFLFLLHDYFFTDCCTIELTLSYTLFQDPKQPILWRIYRDTSYYTTCRLTISADMRFSFIFFNHFFILFAMKYACKFSRYYTCMFCLTRKLLIISNIM